MSAAIAMLALLSALTLAGVASFLDGGLLERSPDLVEDLLFVPLLSVLCATTLAWFYFTRRVRHRWELAVFVALLGAAYYLGARPYVNYQESLGEAAMQSGKSYFSLREVMVGAVVLFTVGRRRLSGLKDELLSPRAPGSGSPWGLALRGLAAATAVLAIAFFASPIDGVSVNRYGLAAYPAGAVIREAYNSNPSEPYPTGIYQYNSLGYRDSEPAPPDAARERVLIVGNFFLSGLGIPNNAELLPAHLRRELEARRPGRYDVVSASFQCNGLVGYKRAIEALTPALGVKIAVVGYCSDLDNASLDHQAVVDRTPSSRIVRRLLPVLWLRDYVHFKAAWHEVQAPPDARLRAELARFGQGQLEELESFAAKRGIRLVFVHYRSGPPPLKFSPEVVHVRIPDELYYRGPNEYWYAQEGTPRPAFNRRLATLLADGIVSLP